MAFLLYSSYFNKLIRNFFHQGAPGLRLGCINRGLPDNVCSGDLGVCFDKCISKEEMAGLACHSDKTGTKCFFCIYIIQFVWIRRIFGVAITNTNKNIK